MAAADDPIIRELLRVLVETQIDLSAAKMLLVAHLPDGSAKLALAVQVSRERYQPFLDSLQQASDQSLLEKLKGLSGPLH